MQMIKSTLLVHTRFVRNPFKDLIEVTRPKCVGNDTKPFNIASYALLTMMVAQVCDLRPGDFIWTGGDCHLYTNHLEQTKLQLSREPRSLPRLKINPEVKDLFAFKFEDFELTEYDPHPHIKAPVAI